MLNWPPDDDVIEIALLSLIAFVVLLGIILSIVWRPQRRVREIVESLPSGFDRLDDLLRDEMSRSRGELGTHLTSEGAKQFEMLKLFLERLDRLTGTNEAKFEQLRAAMESKLSELREDNSRRLEAMRATVDEKLQGTLEKRLGESFKLVSERLEQVHRGLGEMQSLAVGVGDLKKVLTNVKTRGGWGEVQLGALLEQILTPSQFERNVRTKKDSAERVEYAIKLPGREEGAETVVWLPVDSKFPVEDYQRMIDAQERADPAAHEEAFKALRTRIMQSARDISTRYINPPETTDFAIMFLPTEGLFAEIIRHPGLSEELQNKHRVIVAGPTTFAALLNSLQMGFRTLTIQKRSSEVWKVLGEVRTDFGKFAESVDAVKKKLIEASNKIDDVGRRSRAVEKRLSAVGSVELPETMDLVAIAEPELLKEDES